MSVPAVTADNPSGTVTSPTSSSTPSFLSDSTFTLVAQKTAHLIAARHERFDQLLPDKTVCPCDKHSSHDVQRIGEQEKKNRGDDGW